MILLETQEHRKQKEGSLQRRLHGNNDEISEHKEGSLQRRLHGNNDKISEHKKYVHLYAEDGE
jgi:plasmid stabilization system protein ParE